MGHKAVDSAAHVDVTHWVGSLDQGGDEEVLVKVMSVEVASRAAVILKNRKEVADGPASPQESGAISEESREMSKRQQPSRVETKLEGEPRDHGYAAPGPNAIDFGRH